MSKILGIIGGLGPMASVCFYQMITNMTVADKDQEHLHVFIDSNPQTPDRTRYIIGESDDNPFPYLVESGKKLKSIGAEVLAIPCNTAQYFHDDLENEIGLPIINMIRETAMYLKARGIKKVGIMATSGALKAGVYQKELNSCEIDVVVPDSETQEDIMHLIYKNVKAGTQPDMKRFNGVRDKLMAGGVEVIILACTEFSVIKACEDIGAGFIDAMEVMATCAVRACGKMIKPEFEELITK